MQAGNRSRHTSTSGRFDGPEHCVARRFTKAKRNSSRGRSRHGIELKILVLAKGLVEMWSLRCLLIGHDDMLLRRPHRLSLQCSHCGRETKGWNLSRSDQGAMNTWVQVGAGIPAMAAVSWARGSLLRLAPTAAGVFVANDIRVELIVTAAHPGERSDPCCRGLILRKSCQEGIRCK